MPIHKSSKSDSNSDTSTNNSASNSTSHSNGDSASTGRFTNTEDYSIRMPRRPENYHINSHLTGDTHATINWTMKPKPDTTPVKK